MATAPLLYSVHDQELALLERRRVQVTEVIGRGTAATVYRGLLESEARVRRGVAVKLFDVIATDDRDVVVPRLARMARHGAWVQHPNVIETYEFGVLGSAQPYVMTALIEGQSLAKLMEAFANALRRMPLDLGLFIATEVAEALIGARLTVTSEGRQLAIVHGDLSAREVMLSWYGEVKVGDFGIADAIGATSSVRRVAMLARRVTTMAPEVVQGQKCDTRADVFSVGIMLHEMLIGPRFPPDMSGGEMFDHARAGYVHAAVFVPQLPSDVRAIIERAISVDPEDRFPHAGALAYELRRAGMALGVGDGRVFLRNAMQSLADEAPVADESDERPVSNVPGSLRPTVPPHSRPREVGESE